MTEPSKEVTPPPKDDPTKVSKPLQERILPELQKKKGLRNKRQTTEDLVNWHMQGKKRIEGLQKKRKKVK